MKRIIASVLLISMLLMVGCAAHVHQIGKGGTGSDYEEMRQWYILFGLVPINDVDTNDMADGATDYTITTEYNPVDFVVSFFLGFVSISSRTVTVEK